MSEMENCQLDENGLDQATGGKGHTFIRYTVQEGDTLPMIAQKYGCTEEAILRLNPLIRDRRKLPVGMGLTIPKA